MRLGISSAGFLEFEIESHLSLKEQLFDLADSLDISLSDNLYEGVSFIELETKLDDMVFLGLWDSNIDEYITDEDVEKAKRSLNADHKEVEQ